VRSFLCDYTNTFLIIFSQGNHFTIHVLILSGALELIPSITFLCIMHPNLNKGNRQPHGASPELPRMNHSGSGAAFQRVDSGIRSNEHEHLLVAGGGHIRRDTPPTVSVQGKGGSTSGYGAVSNVAAADTSAKP
jgi:hypothetical protein